MAALDAGLAEPVFDVLAVGFVVDFEAASPGLGLAADVALAFDGAAGSTDAFDFDDVAVGRAVAFFGADCLETFEVSEASKVCGGVFAAGPSDGNLLISPRISFSRSAREIVRPFISLTETSSAGAA